ncbi:MAG: hypothetical protein U5K76_14055 [Woeseiaceae bacterium]|nr:hypothetical protein [Woeseiaceae bacterium]
MRMPWQKSGKKTASGQPVDAARLLAAQRAGAGIVAGAVAACVAMAGWVYLAMLFDRYFPWFSVVQGWFIGLAMRRIGRGLDWRAPAAGAVISALAAVLGSFLVALFLTGREFGTGALELVDEISLHTVTTFLARDFGVVGLIYLGFAAVLGAFYANRHLDPRETVALHRYRRAGRNSPDR